MMGKISAWRGERKDASQRSTSTGGMGGLVSIEELNARADKAKMSKSIVGSIKSKPKLHLRRRSFGITRSPPRDPNRQNTPPLHNESLFSNFPALDQNAPFSYSPPPPNSRNASRRPSVSSETRLAVQAPEIRPRTADPTLPRKRSKTAPSAKYILGWDDKPLPLAIDKDAKLKEMGPLDSPERKNSYASSIVRPRTAEGGLQSTIKRSPSKGNYTLIPSLTSPGSRRGSKSTIHSQATTVVPRTRSRANSQATSGSRDTPTSAAPRNSILDEVEGTLTATITELQELQGSWHSAGTPDQASGPPTGTTLQRSTASESPAEQRHGRTASADRPAVQHSDSYFPAVSPTDRPAAHPMPLTPMHAATFPTEEDADSKLQAWQYAYHEQKKHAHAMFVENLTWKKRLEAMKARLSQVDEEKAALVRAAREAEENLQSMLGRLREAKVAEQAAHNELHAAKNDVAILQAKYDSLKQDRDAHIKCAEQYQAKLEEVNTQKIEMLERDSEARKEISVTKKQLKDAVEEIERRDSQPATPVDDLERRLQEAEHRNKALEAELNQLAPNSDLPSTVASLTFRVEDMQKQLNDRDSTIARFRHQYESTKQTLSDLAAQNENLEGKLLAARKAETQRDSPMGEPMLHSKVRQTQDALNTARRERDQFASLLHAEIRRTAIDEHSRKHPSAPFLQKKLDLEEAVEIVRTKAHNYLQGPNPASHDVASLQAEIEYYLHDIVLYKLDCKGYRKDLRRARERIGELSKRNDMSRMDSTGSTSSGGRTITDGT